MSQNGNVLIDVRGVCKRFGSRAILDDVSLSIHEGETVALIGPSGGGKSTLLRCMNGLNTLDAGEVHVGPYSLDCQARGRAAGRVTRDVRQLLGMVFQDFQLFPHLTAIENVALGPCQVLRKPHAEGIALAQKLLTRVGLGDRADAYPQQLSGGQKQRVAIARALAMQPKGLLCDEITSALDPELKFEVLEVLADLKREGMTLVVVTHEIGFARRAADRVFVLCGGRVIEEGPPAEVLDFPRSQRTQEFLRNVLA